MAEGKPVRTAKAPRSATGGAATSGLSLPIGKRTRYALAALAAACGLASGGYSLGSAMARNSIDLAFAIDASNPLIASRYALSEVTNPIQGNRPSNYREVAARALEQDPTAADAAVAIGISSQLENEPALGDKAFAYALMLSRRETRAHVWAIEHAVTMGNIRLALAHYDLAIRTSNAAENSFFPNLADASKEKLVRKELVLLFRKNPPWRDRFLNFAAKQARRPDFISDLVEDLQNDGRRVDRKIIANLVNNLFSKGLHTLAWRNYVESLDKNPGLIRDFKADTPELTAFNWLTEVSPGILPTIIRSDDEYVLDVSKVPSSAGRVATQALRLPPGTYRLAGSFEAPQGTDSPAYRWAISCTDRQPFAMIDLAEGPGTQTYRKAFTVPADCPQQTLTLTARQSSGFQAQNTSFASPTVTRVDARKD